MPDLDALAAQIKALSGVADSLGAAIAIRKLDAHAAEKAGRVRK